MNAQAVRSAGNLKLVGSFAAGVGCSYLYSSMRRKQSVEKQLHKPQQASSAGEKVDSVIDKGRSEVAKAEDKIGMYRKETGQKIDDADRKIEENATKAKTEISSWFNGKRT
ncbi:hypothetical protein K3495_g2844 [Podosphaera aphanis]|nr:hypothetical protein K3495_g2844 [Podosphaera aphanis]